MGGFFLCQAAEELQQDEREFANNAMSMLELHSAWPYWSFNPFGNRSIHQSVITLKLPTKCCAAKPVVHVKALS